MKQKDLKKALPTIILGNLGNVADLAFGDKLWEIISETASGPVANTPETAIEFKADISALAGPAMYYAKSNYGGVQIMLKPESGSNRVFYAGILRDKDGDAIISDDHTYTINEVKARREFTVPDAFKEDGSPVKILMGDRTLKAYAD